MLGLMDVSMSSVSISAVCVRCVLIAVFVLAVVCLCFALMVFRLCIPILSLYVSIEHAILFVYLFGVEAAISSSLSILLTLVCFCSLFSLVLTLIPVFWFFPLFPDLFVRCIPFRWFLS